MGAFIFQYGDGRKRAIPNCFHKEGLSALVSSGHGLSDAPDFLLSLTGINVPGHAQVTSSGQYSSRTHLHRRPDILLLSADESIGTNYPWYGVLTPDTTYADIMRAAAHVNGIIPCEDDLHARVAVSMDSKPISFSVEEGQYYATITSSAATFKNWAWASWVPTADKNLKEKGYYIKDAVCAPDSHGWPYVTPKLLWGTIDSRAEVWAVPHYDAQQQRWSFDWETELYPAPDASWAAYIGGVQHGIISASGYGCTVYTGNGFPSYVISDGPAVWMTLRPISDLATQIDNHPWLATTLPTRAAVIHTDDGDYSKLIASCIFAGDICLAPGAELSITYKGILREFVDGVDA